MTRVRERFTGDIAGVGSTSGVRVRDVVAATYSFDEHVTQPVSVEDTADGWQVTTPSLSLCLVVGGRTPLGAALGMVPAKVATSPVWCSVVDPVARVVMRGVRTRGTAGGDRREWYGATSMHTVTAVAGEWRGTDLGRLAPVDPPCRFGFSSTPRRPSVTSVVTTVVRGVGGLVAQAASVSACASRSSAGE